MTDLIERFGVLIPIVEGILALFTIVHFALATFMDPGKYPKGINLLLKCLMPKFGIRSDLDLFVFSDRRRKSSR